MSTQPAVETVRLSRARDASRHDGRLFADGAWLVGGQALSALALVVGVRMLTEVVPPEVFASVGLAVGVVTLGRNLLCFPFFQAALRYFPEATRAGEVGTLRRVLFAYLGRSSLIVSALIVAIGLPFCAWQSATTLAIPLLIGLFLADVFRTMETDLFNAARRQRAFATIRVVESWARPVAAVVAVRWLGAGTAVVLLGYFCASAAVYAGLFVFGIKRVGVGSSETAGSSDLAERIWRFGLPLVPLAVLEWTSLLGDRYLIGGLLGLKAAGIYAAVYGLMLQPFAMAQQVLELLFRPLYFEAIAGRDEARVRRTFKTWLATTAAVCVAGVIVVTLLRKPITALLLAEPYRGGADLLPFIAAGNAMSALAIVYEKVAHAANRTGLVLAGRTVGAAASVAFGLPMIFIYGVRGAAWAVPVYYGLQLLFCRSYARRLSAPISNGSGT